MLHHYADDGRIMTPPKELEPLLKGSFSAFSKLIGHIRFYYIADEIWDGKSSLIFNADNKPLAAFVLSDGAFSLYLHIADQGFKITDETMLNTIYEMLKKTVPSEHHRPFDQLTMNFDDPAKFPCGYRCEMCLLNKKQNQTDFSASRKFGYLNWLCYRDCVPGIDIERPDPNSQKDWCCPGCISSPWKEECKYYNCPAKKGKSGCLECGEYHSCEIQHDGHYSGQCSLGMTAEEVTKLVIPYCMKERFDIYRNAAL